MPTRQLVNQRDLALAHSPSVAMAREEIVALVVDENEEWRTSADHTNMVVPSNPMFRGNPQNLLYPMLYPTK